MPPLFLCLLLVGVPLACSAPGPEGPAGPNLTENENLAAKFCTEACMIADFNAEAERFWQCYDHCFWLYSLPGPPGNRGPDGPTDERKYNTGPQGLQGPPGDL